MSGASDPHQKLPFGGTWGNLGMIVGLPAIVIYLYFIIAFNEGAMLPAAGTDYGPFLASLQPTWTAFGVYVAWFCAQAALQAWMPGKIVQGTPLPDGRRLGYKMNGLASMTFTMVVVFGGHALDLWSIGFIFDNFGALITSMMIFSLGLSIFLYGYGKRHGEYRGTGNRIHDFWMGTGHNPRLPHDGLFDLKFFCEARPGLTMWMLVDASFAYAQYRSHGFVSTSMWLVCAFHWMYVLDYYWNEPALLTTMDIKHENFGYMLTFGDLVWVPMTYSLQALYLIDHVHELPAWAAVAIVALNLLGWWIFRSVNNQKNKFRGDPDNAKIWGKPAEYIETEQGNRLLVSGFWGWSRHFNYVGDILMAISWSLPCLFGAIGPYFYPIYFTALLLHRERRDNELCAEKYGEDWVRYTKRVPARIVPGVY